MHPTDEQLIGWVLGETGGDVGTHLAGDCTACTERVREIERLVATMRSDRDPEPPLKWVEAAVGLFGKGSLAEGVLRRVKRWGGGLLEEAARLVADSAQPALAPAGLRSLGLARRLRFEARGVELDLQIEPVPGGARVTGQFAMLEPEPAPLASAGYLLVNASGACVDGETDPLGEFDARLDDAAGLELRVIHGGTVVVFEVPESRNDE